MKSVNKTHTHTRRAAAHKVTNKTQNSKSVNHSITHRAHDHSTHTSTPHTDTRHMQLRPRRLETLSSHRHALPRAHTHTQKSGHNRAKQQPAVTDVTARSQAIAAATKCHSNLPHRNCCCLLLPQRTDAIYLLPLAPPACSLFHLDSHHHQVFHGI